ncbi:Trehalose-phosphate phosphatase B [Porphyridium purpureum]|uniref:Trehalose 6-phosphate phosphatase n=1 Tax=Porphyridium purpureum TaxID=35688 RepID=A0A5J4YLR4_PORPP|nr:Trehalose-phosphate phosphatase B [Porphyridium purpureum]|eukprot:POR4075..scf249_10
MDEDTQDGRENEARDVGTLAHALEEKQMQLLKERCRGKQIYLMVDYDGTLAPIVQDPSAAHISEETRDLLRALARFFPVAVVSGRSLIKLYQFVQLDSVYYAGSHGFEIAGPFAFSGAQASDAGSEQQNGTDRTACGGRAIDKSRALYYCAAEDCLPALQKAAALLKDSVLPGLHMVPELLIEDNVFSLSVHYRQYLGSLPANEPSRVPELLQAIDSLVLSELPKLRRAEGKMVAEIRPRIDWDKGYAVEFLLNHVATHGAQVSAMSARDAKTNSDPVQCFPLYIGDDVTDEDAFSYIRRTKTGLSIVVHDPHVDTTRISTHADFTLHDPKQVHAFLERLLYDDSFVRANAWD